MELLLKLGEYQDYIGIVIGAVLLLVAGLFLPSSVRKYVWTAGFAVIFYRIFQVTINKKKLAAADKERDQLRNEHARLEEDLTQHKARLAELNQQLDAVRQERNALVDDVKALATDKEKLDSQRDQLNQRLNDIVSRNNELIEKVDQQEQVVSIFDQANLAFENLNRIPSGEK